MDSSKLILTGAVLPPVPLEERAAAAVRTCVAGLERGRFDAASQQKKIQVAKDFESILLSKVLDGMRNTIGDWGLDEDGASQQIQGIFWLYLAQHMADNGGFGLWKNIYQFLTESTNVDAPQASLDRNL
jgi:Rod binding domain-containing protein